MVVAGLEAGKNINQTPEQILQDAELKHTRTLSTTNSSKEATKALIDEMTQQFSTLLKEAAPIAYAGSFEGDTAEVLEQAQHIAERLQRSVLKAEERDAKNVDPLQADRNMKAALKGALRAYDSLFSPSYHGKERKIIRETLESYAHDRRVVDGTLDNQDLHDKRLFPSGIDPVRTSGFQHEVSIDELTQKLDDIQRRAKAGLQSSLEYTSTDLDPTLKKELLGATSHFLAEIKSEMLSIVASSTNSADSVAAADVFHSLVRVNEEFQEQLKLLESKHVPSLGDKCRLEIDQARAIFIRSIAQASHEFGVQDPLLDRANEKATKVIGTALEPKQLDFDLKLEELSVLTQGNKNPDASKRMEKDVMVATLRHEGSAIKLAFDRPAGMSEPAWKEKLARIGELLSKIDTEKLYSQGQGLAQLDVNNAEFQELLALSGGKIVQLKNIELASPSGGLGNLVGIDCITYQPKEGVTFENVIFSGVNLSSARLSIRNADGSGVSYFTKVFQVLNCVTVNTMADVVVEASSAKDSSFVLNGTKDMSGASWNADLRGIPAKVKSFFYRGPVKINIQNNNAINALRLPTDIDCIVDKKGNPIAGMNKNKIVELYKGSVYKLPKNGEPGVFGELTEKIDSFADDVDQAPASLTANDVLNIMKQNNVISGEQVNLGSKNKPDMYYTTNMETGDPQVSLLYKKDDKTGGINLIFGRRDDKDLTLASKLKKKKLEKLHRVAPAYRQQFDQLTPTQAIQVISKFSGEDVADLLAKNAANGQGLRGIGANP